MNDELRIPISKTKVVLLLIGPAAFVVASVWLWAAAETFPHPFRARLAAVPGFAFFSLCAAYGCMKLFDTKPRLVVDKEGNIDNSSALSVGRVPWEDITAFKVTTISGQRFLTVELVDPQKYANRGHYIQRKINAVNIQMTGSPINISSNTLSMNLGDLHTALMRFFEQYKASNA